MRRYGGLFDEVVGLVNLWRAWQDFERGKRGRPTVRRFAFDVDRHVVRLHDELRGATYRPGAYRLSLVREPKVRLIAAAPVRDRIVHHALYRVLAPRLDRSLVDTTYACLPGRGSHRAVLRFLRALRTHRFVLLLDVRRYFLSIDRAILLDLMARRIKDRPLLALLRTVAESGAGLYRRPDVAAALDLPPDTPPEGCGLPIGNLTSQWWGNHYLSGLDHFVKRALKLPHAQRYMDDAALFADDRRQLEDARAAVADWLWRERRLRLKDPDAPVRGTGGSRFDYLGCCVRREGVEPGPQVLVRARRRMRALLLAGQTDRVARSLASYRGIVLFGAASTGVSIGVSKASTEGKGDGRSR